MNLKSIFEMSEDEEDAASTGRDLQSRPLS